MNRFDGPPRPFRAPILTTVAFVYSAMMWVLGLVVLNWLPWLLLGAALSFVLVQIAAVVIRGSAVRVSPAQFPEINDLIERFSAQLGIRPPPAYVRHGGGELNAFVLRVFGKNLLVLNSEMVVAARGTPGALEMIVGHELAHVAQGHLRWGWFLIPARWTPFLGSALSRAREYQCDAIGAGLSGLSTGAMRGFVLLAVGPELADAVDVDTLRRQDEELRGGSMTLASWMLSHPPLVRRLEALVQGRPPRVPMGTRMAALTMAAGLFVVGLVGSVLTQIGADDWEVIATEVQPASAAPTGAAEP